MRLLSRRELTALIISIVCAVPTALPSVSHAESVLWNTAKAITLYTPLAVAYWYDYFGENLGSLSNPIISVQYHTRVTNTDTGVVVACGSAVPKGTRLSFEFIPHKYTDVYWFASGWSYDSPYGDWRRNADPPPITCETKDFIGENVGDRNGQAFTYSIYSALIVAPPDKNVSGVDGMACGAPNENGSIDCTANTAGTFASTFNFASTRGKFYGRLWSPQYFVYSNDDYGCYGSNSPMVTGSDTRYAQPEYILKVPAQSVSCPVTIIEPTGSPPVAPALSARGTCTIGIPHSISMTSSDPDLNRIRYGIDWDAIGSIDQFVPAAGYVRRVRPRSLRVRMRAQALKR